ncbi:hypothetical protein PHMEG_00012344 [Phytophthora megakarya]|uniref:Uncharacterized protein n=1 Tax=Phytophthora megakarya TaxID=4795 RepID=A0A225W9F2_9STRA|nr:hypothetical protein PHMEG_00012344 [Phytophthora megakarya]
MIQDSTITVVDEASRDRVTIHALHVVDRIIPHTFVSDDAGCASKCDTTASCPPTETELVSTGHPQSADLVIDAECLYAYLGKCEWPEDNNNEN